MSLISALSRVLAIILFAAACGHYINSEEYGHAVYCLLMFIFMISLPRS